MKMLVIGGTGGTGREIISQVIAQGHSVTALVRSGATAQALLPGATILEGDARDKAVVARGLVGCSAVISALGTGMSPFGQVTLLSDATGILVAAMRKADVRRLVCITGVGAGTAVAMAASSTIGFSNRCSCVKSIRTRTVRRPS